MRMSALTRSPTDGEVVATEDSSIAPVVCSILGGRGSGSGNLDVSDQEAWFEACDYNGKGTSQRGMHATSLSQVHFIVALMVIPIFEA